MINEKGQYLQILKNKLDQCRRRQAMLANRYNTLASRYNALRAENRLLRQQLMTAKKSMLPIGEPE